MAGKDAGKRERERRRVSWRASLHTYAKQRRQTNPTLAYGWIFMIDCWDRRMAAVILTLSTPPSLPPPPSSSSALRDARLLSIM